MSATADIWPSPACVPAVALWTTLLLAAAFTLWTLLFRSRLRWAATKGAAAQLPPGSFGWPLVGETLDFVSCAYSSRPEAFVDKRRLL